MTRNLFLLIVFLLAGVTQPASPHALNHVARDGETLIQLAIKYYGNSDLSMVIRAANGFIHPDDGTLIPGEWVVIPETIPYQFQAGDTWESIADKYLASEKRGVFLAELNKYEEENTPPEGTLIRIPYHLRHIFAADETLKSVSKLYYGKNGSLRFLMKYNFTRKRRFSRGEVLIIPLMDISFTEEEMQRLAEERNHCFSDSDVEAQTLAREAIAQIKNMFEEGHYIKMVSIAQQFLGRGKLTVPQLIGIHNYLAFAYVALGETTLAFQAFQKALELEPEMELSPITTSPKIRVVFKQAKSALQQKKTPTKKTKTAGSQNVALEKSAPK
jgi:tetratricopeptide (TPR) repeat protein